jgi:hypothetical protein
VEGVECDDDEDCKPLLECEEEFELLKAGKHHMLKPCGFASGSVAKQKNL